jgi:hypothetical protein
MTLCDIQPPGQKFCIYLCSRPRRPADIAEQLNVLGQLSVVVVDTLLGQGDHDLCSPNVVDDLIQLASRPECVAILASPPCN